MDFDSVTEKAAFKAGFMAYCKEAGWNDDQIEYRVKTAWGWLAPLAARLAPWAARAGQAMRSGGSLLGAGALGAGAAGAYGAARTVGENVPNAGLLFLGAPIAGGLALGGGLGWGAAKLTDPKITDDDLKADELEQAYRIQAKRLKARRDYEKYRSSRGLDS